MARLLRMPEVAANTVEAVLSGWSVSENTPFSAQDTIARVETEKAVVDLPADADGVILKTLVQPGTVVEVASPIALLGDPGEQVHDLGALLVELGVAPADALSVSGAAQGVSTASLLPGTAPAPTPTATTSGAGGSSHGGRVFSSPLARRLAREAGLSLTDIRGTGPGGRVVRRDIQHALDARAALHSDPAMARQAGAASVPASAGAATFADIPHTRMGRAIAARLTQSTREVPHFFLRSSARVNELLRLRGRLNDSSSVSVSVNDLVVMDLVVMDLVVMAAARAHLLVPAMNVIWMPDAVRSFSGVDISVAVATDRGLVAPVLRGVERMTLSALAATRSELVGRARSGRLQQDELEGGTLTVTNLGGYGVEDFTAMINPPQSAILAVGAARREPVVTKGKVKVGTVMSVTLSVDHRAIDGVVAARWMAALVSLLEEPVRILV